MTDRPLGIVVACIFFLVVGVGSFFGGIGAFRLWDVLSSGPPPSVVAFVYLIPFFMILLGGLGVFAAIGLWNANASGRTAGLVWAVLWVSEELLLGVWATVGPEVVREASGGLGANALRAIAGAFLFYYLRTVGARYVEE